MSVTAFLRSKSTKGRLSYNKSLGADEETIMKNLNELTSVFPHFWKSCPQASALTLLNADQTVENRTVEDRTGELEINISSSSEKPQSRESDIGLKTSHYQDGLIAVEKRALEQAENEQAQIMSTKCLQNHKRELQSLSEESHTRLAESKAQIKENAKQEYEDALSFLDSRSISDQQERAIREQKRQRQIQENYEMLKEGDAKRQQIKKTELQKAREQRERLEQMKKNQVAIMAIEAQAKDLMTQCQHKTHALHVEAMKIMEALERDSEEANELLDQSEKDGATEDNVQTMNDLKRKMNSGIQKLAELISQIETAAKKEAEMKLQQEQAKAKAEAEAARKQEEQKEKQQREELIKQTVLTGSTDVAIALPDHLKDCVSATAYAVYVQLKEKLDQVDKLCAPLRSPSTQPGKKLKLDLQKAVAHPVNAISSQSADHLRDKVFRLLNLLAGKTVTISDESINATAHPQGKVFCLEYLAKKLVLQAAQQVSSKHESAFPLAAVATAVWQLLPEVGQLLMAHFYSICPYTVPFYIPQTTDMSDSEYYKTLGYVVNEDGSVEDSDQYLKRMSGVLRFYAAIIQSSPPGGGQTGHPHGVEYGWIWLTRLVNLPPKPDVTATLLFDFLEVAGHAVLQVYGRQFKKLLAVIASEYYVRIEKVTPEGKRGPLTRLRQFLEKCIKSGSIPQPEGYLSQEFWTRASTPPPVDLTGY